MRLDSCKSTQHISHTTAFFAFVSFMYSVSTVIYKGFFNSCHSFIYAGLPRSGKSQGKTKIFQGQGKVREFCKKSGKISVLVKVSEKSGNFVNALRSKSREKCKEMEHEEKNIDGLQKKLKLM